MSDAHQKNEVPQSGLLRAPELLGVLDVTEVSGASGIYRFDLPPETDGEFTLLLKCDAREFPFEKYCRFVRHPGGESPYTFPRMEFHKDPPGIRLGPWPGWRGIPDFPVITASCGSARVKLQPAFWGDESACGVLRLFARFSHRENGRVTIEVPDPRIIPREASVYRTQAARARPHTAELRTELAGTHPRLLVTPGLLPVLRGQVSGSHLRSWQRVVDLWNNRDLPFKKTAESKCVPGRERLSGEDRVLLSALIALVTEKGEDKAQALRAYGEYVGETRRSGFEPLGIDTQAGEVLFILSVGYDWLYDWMPESDRQNAWEQIEQVAKICRSFLTPERTDYGQAHYLGCGLGLLAYSFLASGEAASKLRAELRGAFDCAMELLSDDGSYPHGINLWIYEFGFLLRWIELIGGCSGEDIWSRTGKNLARASEFRAATLSSDGKHGLTFGDPQYRVGGDSWCHYLIASRTGSGIAQWLGERLTDLPHEGVDFRNAPARRRVYEFLFYDPAIGPTAPGPGVRNFPGIGQATVRSAQTYFTMRAGPPLGTKRYSSGEYGAYGHSDPASGSFLLEHNGKFIASGPGPVYRRDTALHNVVTIDGKGQVGDSTVWLPDFIPPEVLPPTLELDSVGTRVVLTADLARTYLPHLGVERYTRSVYIDPGRIVLGVDNIACSATHSLEWNMHSHLPFTRLGGKEPLLFELGDRVRMVLLSPLDAKLETGLTEFVPAYPNDGTRDYRCAISVKSSAARFIWCYLFASQTPPVLRGESNGTFLLELADRQSLYCDGARFLLRGES